MHALEFASGDIDIASLRCACRNDISIEALRQCSHIDIGIIYEFHTFLLHDRDTAVDDLLLELEVWNAVAEQATSSCTTVEDCHLIALVVELVGCCQSCRTATYHSHLLAVALWMFDSHESLHESTFGNGTFVLTVGHGLACGMIEHTRLLTQCRTYTSGELREIVGLLQYLICSFPLSSIESIVPFRILVAKRTSPVAERHTTVHTARSLLLTFF